LTVTFTDFFVPVVLGDGVGEGVADGVGVGVAEGVGRDLATPIGKTKASIKVETRVTDVLRII
jgi:hypothetical protein